MNKDHKIKNNLKGWVTVTVVIGAFLFCLHAQAQEKLYHNEFSLGDVSLLDGRFKQARDLNIQTLLKYNVDRLLAPYRKEAGLVPKDSSYKNWEGLDGHIGGHYLSAMAMNYAATKNEACKKRMDYMISELKACQDANTLNYPDWGTGYVGGVPNSKTIWTTLKKGDFTAFHAAWVPWYNVHKMYAGLRDCWIYAGNENARNIFLKFCDWAITITAGLTDEQMQAMLDTEQGGMNEVLADAYQLTGMQKYLMAAKRFSHKMLLTPMSEGIDNLDNKHANTQIPKVIGFERIGELSMEEKYRKAAGFFWETVTSHRSLAFGGNSRREFFPAVAACSDFINDVEGPESCNSYNMLKLTEDLFRANPSVQYIDYYERTVLNHILSAQNPETGGYVYFTPVRPRSYRVYSAPNQAMWCCVGSGMENHSKYNEFIYTHSNDSLYVNLFIASDLNWREKGIKLRQETKFPDEEQARLIIKEGAANFSLIIRYPSWVTDGALKITVNGKPVSIDSHPSSFIVIRRKWQKGDDVRILLPMHDKIEHLPNMPGYIAFLHGPVLLGAKTGTEDMKGLIADDSRWGQIPSGEKLPLDEAPIIISESMSAIASDLVPVKGKSLHYTMKDLKLINPVPVELEPFYQIHNSRYMMYWMALTSTQYQSYLDSIALAEKEMLALQKRTVDFVATGEQQPEADHNMQSLRSRSGSSHDQFFREAYNGGYFSYNMAINGQDNLSLMVSYWGAEWGNRKFEIYIDDQKLITEDNTGRWNQSKFFDIEYTIPASLTKGKNQVRVKFQGLPDNTAGAVYYLRIIKQKSNSSPEAYGQGAHNPIIFADVPDMSMIRVGNIYYMSSTTMHMSPGVPIMKSTDLVNWKLINYAYDTLADMDELNLANGKSTYGRGSWASCMRYHNGIYYVTTFAQTTGKTYIYSTKNLETGPWKRTSFKPSFHDHSLFFDDDGKVYLLYGNGKLRLIELNEDVSGIKPGGIDQVVIENASAPAGSSIGLGAEGSQLFKVNGKYYLFNITWPRGGMRTVVIHRADKITGPYEGRVGLQDLGVAQGGLIDMPNGNWYAYLFRDFGAVGRVPYLVPLKWEDGWPVLGVEGKVPEALDLPLSNGLIPGIVASDEFTRKKGEPLLPLIWQWNHNPDNHLWSVTKRKGFLRLITGRIDTTFLLARNTLTQRTIGPVCSGTTFMDITGLKDGDFAGLALLQKKYGLVGIRADGNRKSIVMVSAESGRLEEMKQIPVLQDGVYLKAECDFADKKDIANFFYSLDGKTWIAIGPPLKMAYTLPHFMGYRFGLFNYATKHTGGYADFDYFHITDTISGSR